MTNLIVWMIVGLIAGYLASTVLSGRGMGIVAADIVIGLLGAVLGGFLPGIAGIAVGGFVGEVLVAFVGAVILLLLFRTVALRGGFGLR
jgi:uncharacterized membrane protein YeaQ/YmgE (transglycosylase-associated protein family)